MRQSLTAFFPQVEYSVESSLVRHGLARGDEGGGHSFRQHATASHSIAVTPRSLVLIRKRPQVTNTSSNDPVEWLDSTPDRVRDPDLFSNNVHTKNLASSRTNLAR